MKDDGLISLACNDCGLPYDDPAWIEAVVANHIWNEHLSPRGNESGILCVTCMARRAVKAGLYNVRVRLTAGPFVTSGGHSGEVQAGRSSDRRTQ
jgi:hypothetical protein